LSANTNYHLTVAIRQLFCLKYTLEVNEFHATSANFEPRDWQFSIIDYVLYGILPNDPKEADSIQRRSPCFYYDPVVKMLFRHSYDNILLHCLSSSKAHEALKEAHDVIYGAHQPGLKLKDRLRWLSYYWPIMITDGVEYAKWCKACQIPRGFHTQTQGVTPSHSCFMAI